MTFQELCKEILRHINSVPLKDCYDISILDLLSKKEEQKLSQKALDIIVRELTKKEKEVGHE